MNSRVLVTGGAGFIGSHLVDEFLLQGYSVRVIDNFSTGSRNNIRHVLGEVELIEGDIRDYQTVLKAVKNIDIIVHQAALPSVPRSVSDPITTNDVNVNGTLNLLWAAVEAGTEKFLFASSSSIYGNSVELPKHEKLCPCPLSPYAVSKLTAENYCKVFSNTYGLRTICLRYFNVFGPRQDPASEYSAVIPKFINMIADDKQPIIYGDGLQSRDFTFVKNVVKGNLLAIKSSAEKNLIMNCACNVSITINQLVEEINGILGKNAAPIYWESRTSDVKHSYADIKLALEKISYRPEIQFREGLEITVNSMLNK
ncbi:MAG: SDR family oxidoreductase [Ignavibacteriales bacterium]|nr:SDR family oxidoreductase [Ignavibacteriales bacterium]